ncbi:hypothetical protein [Sebaldella sp. S0638]|uniref:hypothetical protein n=1 Tax=Sebaldella sp. S0638 TaxID=2957809 RepID=UPI0020A1DC9F|nr:hypothetical protein [Sebaldella sp. S0638]MCP1226750.1 hypothetical protein [Sebaldella sp. S0638]
MEKLILYIGNSKIFQLYTESFVFNNWLAIALILFSLTVIADLIINKSESYIYDFWQWIKLMDQKSGVLYKKRDSK